MTCSGPGVTPPRSCGPIQPHASDGDCGTPWTRLSGHVSLPPGNGATDWRSFVLSCTSAGTPFGTPMSLRALADLGRPTARATWGTGVRPTGGPMPGNWRAPPTSLGCVNDWRKSGHERRCLGARRPRTRTRVPLLRESSVGPRPRMRQRSASALTWPRTRRRWPGPRRARQEPGGHPMGTCSGALGKRRPLTWRPKGHSPSPARPPCRQ